MRLRGSWVLLITMVMMVVTEMIPTAQAGPYLEDDADVYEDDYIDNSMDRMFQNAQKRACIRRGGNCDHRANDCCYNSSCRCNLWGSNCRCQRMDAKVYEDDYIDNSVDRMYQNAQKRSSLIYLVKRACIRRGGNCDHRANDCCYNSSCRCDLWGSNCRCERLE